MSPSCETIVVMLANKIRMTV